MKLRTFTTALLATLSLSVFAADTQVAPAEQPTQNPDFFQRMGQNRRGNRGGQGFRGGRRGGFNMGMFNPLARMKTEIELRNKFPEEYAKIDKAILAEYDKIAQLAKKANLEYKEDMNVSILRLRVKYPKEFAEIDKKALDNSFEAFKSIMELAKKEGISLYPQRRRGPMQAPKAPEKINRKANSTKTSMKELRSLYPEEMKAIFMNLRSKDAKVKNEARKQLLELDAKAQAAKAAKTKATK
jgi:hypothetical protein